MVVDITRRDHRHNNRTTLNTNVQATHSSLTPEDLFYFSNPPQISLMTVGEHFFIHPFLFSQRWISRRHGKQSYDQLTTSYHVDVVMRVRVFYFEKCQMLNVVSASDILWMLITREWIEGLMSVLLLLVKITAKWLRSISMKQANSFLHVLSPSNHSSPLSGTCLLLVNINNQSSNSFNWESYLSAR